MPKIVDEYTIALDEKDGFITLLFSFKLDDGSIAGPFAMPPAYVHTFADELTIASVRGAPKRANHLPQPTDDDAAEITGG